MRYNYTLLWLLPLFSLTFINAQDLKNYDIKSNEQVEQIVNSLKIFPNPVTKGAKLNLKFSSNINAKLSIYDLTGKLILTDGITDDSTKLVNVFSLNNGVYLLQIKTDNSITTRKIIIER